MACNNSMVVLTKNSVAVTFKNVCFSTDFTCGSAVRITMHLLATQDLKALCTLRCIKEVLDLWFSSASVDCEWMCSSSGLDSSCQSGFPAAFSSAAAPGKASDLPPSAHACSMVSPASVRLKVEGICGVPREASFSCHARGGTWRMPRDADPSGLADPQVDGGRAKGARCGAERDRFPWEEATGRAPTAEDCGLLPPRGVAVRLDGCVGAVRIGRIPRALLYSSR
mmetsp:Transcript_13509/g.32648  ORF Transcript_13509/g.32648 Transcript_13509/m.32648 type:complete len:225 (+) Transcript_13509:392-1066(+)